LEIDDLLPAVDAASMLGFAEVAQGDVMIADAGKEFSDRSNPSKEGWTDWEGVSANR
jgi:hypothetical protein